MKVYSLRQTNPAPPLPLLGLELECGGGFYVRTLIEDLARALGTRAHMTALERTKQVRAVRHRGFAGFWLRCGNSVLPSIFFFVGSRGRMALRA